MTFETQNVSVGKIEQELKKLKRSAPENKIQAALFNLIIYTDEKRYNAYFQDLLVQVMKKFPCRIIRIEAHKESKEDYLRADVAIKSPGDLVCEQITLQASGKKIATVPYVLLPYLISDLPIYLLWGENPSEEKTILPYFQQFASSLIFDSECTNNLKLFSQEILKLSKTLNANLIDMNWTRIRGWREAVAKTFYTPEKFKLLSACKMIQITYNNKPDEFFSHQRRQPIYLQAWLASQLKWHFDGITKVGDITRISYKNSHHQPIAIDLCPKTRSEFAPGALLAVEVMCEDQHTFIVCRKDSSPNVTVSISSHETCDLPLTMRLPDQDRHPSFIRDLFYGSNGDHYLKMLHTLALQDYL